MYRVHRTERHAESGYHHPHLREPEQRAVVSGGRRHRGKKQ
nr:hypothetical protein [Limosilactobacillus reuteri]